jgi:hypothetical protein
MLKPSFCLLSVFFLAGLFIPNLAIANQKQASVDVPSDSRLSCDEAIANVKGDLTQRGFFVQWRMPRGVIGNPQVKMDKSTIQTRYYGYPSDRTERVIFVLGEISNLYSSPKLMATLASQIMADCNNVGMVSFAYWMEGSANVGFFSDNTARTFINIYAIRPREDQEKLQNMHSRRLQTPDGVRFQYQWGFDFTL